MSQPSIDTIKLSFVSRSTSLHDIKCALTMVEETGQPLDLYKTDIEGVMNCSPTDKNPAIESSSSGHLSNLTSGRNNVWSMCDFKLATSQIREVVVEVEGLERADRFVRICKARSGGVLRSQDDTAGRGLDGPELEMEVEELMGLVRRLFPLCVAQGLDVPGEMGVVRRVSGIWEDHDCSQID
ncbi:hypothetical protein BDN72DRAFT_536126 [Pluteus cervinus]|uniref:Uncharacterized protein n=1 Tax=Pluteus cervinus TaxID=181527 RepID=A0ACD3AZU7_9AGAR|nr:hypothetical protein BDN72DRAFT_536126 [Pluteus cervinus]